MTEIVQHRGGTAAAWASANTVLYAREIGVETDTDKFKIGDGSTPWNSLPYASGGASGTASAADDVTFTPTGTISATNVQAAIAELGTEKIATTARGVANGVASLGSDGKVPAAQLPAASGGSTGTGQFLSSTATITTQKSASNPTLNEAGALPENIIKVGDTYWMVYCKPSTGYTTIDVRLASASSPEGPWTPYSGNPVLTTGDQSWETASAANGASIIEHEGTFYIFYGVEGSSGKVAGIGVATATDITGPYTKHAANPIVSPGATGAWDSLRAHEPSVILVDGTWVMAYMGEDTDFPKNYSEQVGIATATDPLGTWTKLNPTTPAIPLGAAGTWDAGCVADPSLFYEDGTYWCVYSGIAVAEGTPWEIGIARATNPAGPWTKHGTGPILSVGGSGAFDSYGVFRGALYREGETYHLPYAGVPSTGETAQAKGGSAVLVVTGGSDALSVAHHEAATDPHPQYLTRGEGDAAYVRTVNGTAPDASGNVVVEGGTGSGTGDASWTTPTLQNSWTNVGGEFATAAYRKDGQGFVWLRGAVQGGTNDTAIFTLPVGYRPVATVGFSTARNNAFAQLQVKSTGVVTFNSGTGGGFIDVARFYAG